MRLLSTFTLSLVVLLISNCRQAAPTGGEAQIPAIALEKTQCKLEIDGWVFRDLNHNGKLDIYEDIRQPIDARVEDLLAQMTLEEKAGLMFIDGTAANEDATLEKKPDDKGPGARRPAAIENISERKLSHFNLWQIPESPVIMATWYNNLQAYAEATRLGIPVTIASDPRHHFSENIFSMQANRFSQFCETPGLAAIGDTALVEQFADIVRREYLAVGFREALHPQVDLATEPRWPRISGTFGEDAQLSARLVRAYIKGLQGPALSSNSVAAMTKHFPGGGPQKEGLDPHFEFQQGQIYPGNNFDYHLIPFEAAIDAGTAAIMPYYGVPTGQTAEDVGMAFNKSIITGLLRDKYKYDGVVCTDWGLITDAPLGPDYVWPARAWGVEQLSEADRVFKVIEAGCDQFGGEHRQELVVQLVREGRLSEERINTSARRILKQKFQLGLFDNPFVDESLADSLVGRPEAIALGEQSQQRAMTLLKNEGHTLPLEKGKWKVYVEGIDSAVIVQYATPVQSPEEADFAIIRINTPWYPVETKNFMARGFHHGGLDFPEAEKARILKVLQTTPTIVDIYLDRPAVIPDITAHCKALVGNFGASSKSVCEVLFGNARPEGKLPFELPASMDAVKQQKADVPYDSEKPLFAFGFGLRYE
ncbi:MAG: glycoside hydrolase family 3 C-terminal domain-containing protein [Lewinellaceae bacterium]|nr:glycoside hydrolase family 3 C-terminal domain-containing protein [Lewinellaceae bacterium]